MPILLALILGKSRQEVIFIFKWKLISLQVFNMRFLCWLVVSLLSTTSMQKVMTNI